MGFKEETRSFKKSAFLLHRSESTRGDFKSAAKMLRFILKEDHRMLKRVFKTREFYGRYVRRTPAKTKSKSLS